MSKLLVRNSLSLQRLSCQVKVTAKVKVIAVSLLWCFRREDASVSLVTTVTTVVVAVMTVTMVTVVKDAVAVVKVKRVIS